MKPLKKTSKRYLSPPINSYQVLNELVGDQSMERFRNEYEKLHRALKTSYESEKRLVKRYVSVTTGPSLF